jgi:hypothetical protein
MHFLWQQIMYCIGNWLTLIKHIKVEFYKLKLVNLSLSFMFWLCFHFRRSERLVAHTVNLVPTIREKVAFPMTINHVWYWQLTHA